MYLAPAQATVQGLLAALSGPLPGKIAAKAKDVKLEADLRQYTLAIVNHLVDIRDYHLTDPQRFTPVPKEKLISLLKESPSSVSLDLDLEIDTISRKVLQVDSSHLINEFVLNPTDDKIKPMFREVAAQEGAFWLYVVIRDKVQDVPLLHCSR